MTTVDQGPSGLDESGLAAIGKHWGVLLFLGITSLVVGVLALAWPGKTVVVVAVLMAAWLIVSGIFQVVRGFSRGLSGGMRALLFISGGLSLILGFFAISGIWEAVEILAIFIGIGFLFRGFALLFGATDEWSSRGWSIFLGILMIIGGFTVLVWPAISLATLAWVIGIWLIVGGVFEIFGAFRLRKLAKAS
jgi:uncharacterized membrane protein HdeD (DUF308 family)